MKKKIETYNNCKYKAKNKGMKGKKRKKVPKQEYTFKPIIKKEKKDGINKAAYCDKIFLPLLYLFYK